MSYVDSIKAKLRNRAIEEKRTIQEILTIYGLERALYRLSISPHNKNFVLKGGILLYAIFDSDFTRGTSDVDLLGQKISNDLDSVKKMFVEIFEVDYPDDGIIFDVSTLKSSKISEHNRYSGINISIQGVLDKTKITVRIDIGFGDTVCPEPVVMKYPTLLNQLAPVIQTYSKESIIAEKFEAIVSLGKANSRMKDFYDIYVMLNSFTFQSGILVKALKGTFANRKTSYDSISAFQANFLEDMNRKKMWAAFLKNKMIGQVLSFKEVIEQIREFLLPIVDMMKQSDTIDLLWDSNDKIWK